MGRVCVCVWGGGGGNIEVRALCEKGVTDDSSENSVGLFTI